MVLVEGDRMASYFPEIFGQELPFVFQRFWIHVNDKQGVDQFVTVGKLDGGCHIEFFDPILCLCNRVGTREHRNHIKVKEFR